MPIGSARSIGMRAIGSDWKIVSIGKRVPDSDVIRLRQEDLWVYETLLRVISKTKRRR